MDSSNNRINYHIDLQLAYSHPLPVSEEQLVHWATLALSADCEAGEVTLRVVDAPEILALNQQYRQQAKTTNVLAFPAHIPEHVPLDIPFFGDVIICPEVLAEESMQGGLPLEAHWAHIVIHGVLHLLGYDHIDPKDEVKMQALEIELLQQLGYQNPYLTEDFSRD